MPNDPRQVIDSFRFEFGFLSNFHEASLWLDGVRYPSAEHAYQAIKSLDPETQRMIREAKTPGIAKKLGRCIQLRSDWVEVRVSVMERIIRAKFENPLLRAMLLATGDAELIEGNAWNDTLWGICRGKGENLLGKILEQVRAECSQEEEEMTHGITDPTDA